jgi:hypothetical protein
MTHNRMSRESKARASLLILQPSSALMAVSDGQDDNNGYKTVTSRKRVCRSRYNGVQCTVSNCKFEHRPTCPDKAHQGVPKDARPDCELWHLWKKDMSSQAQGNDRGVSRGKGKTTGQSNVRRNSWSGGNPRKSNEYLKLEAEMHVMRADQKVRNMAAKLKVANTRVSKEKTFAKAAAQSQSQMQQPQFPPLTEH